MTEITFKNNPIHLEGTEVSKGDVAPNFKVLDNSLNEVLILAYVINKLANLMKKLLKKMV